MLLSVFSGICLCTIIETAVHACYMSALTGTLASTSACLRRRLVNHWLLEKFFVTLILLVQKVSCKADLKNQLWSIVEGWTWGLR